MELSDSYVVVKDENDCKTPLQFHIYFQVHKVLMEMCSFALGSETVTIIDT